MVMGVRARGRSCCLRRVGMDAEWLLLEDGSEVSGRSPPEGRELEAALREPRLPGPKDKWKRASGRGEEEGELKFLGEGREERFWCERLGDLRWGCVDVGTVGDKRPFDSGLGLWGHLGQDAQVAGRSRVQGTAGGVRRRGEDQLGFRREEATGLGRGLRQPRLGRLEPCGAQPGRWNCEAELSQLEPESELFRVYFENDCEFRVMSPKKLNILM